MLPFIKWVGGKRQILPELEKRLPSKMGTYFEPFLGGGALFFHLQPKKAVISDINKELINTYHAVKSSHTCLLEYLLLMETAHSKEFYKEIVSIDRNVYSRSLSLKNSKELRAARFIYLNKSSFNGLYRVNSLGKFNTPWNQKTKVTTFDETKILEIRKYLKSNDIKIRCASFLSIKSLVKKDDFVYLDPPYDYEKNAKSFDAYQKNGFGKKGQIKLANFCKELDKLGVKFMLSNHDTTLIRNLYEGFDFSYIYAKRMINSDGEKRGPVKEVIIRNYNE